MNYKDHIISDANIMLGKPVIKGTRITVAQILKMMSEGASIDDLITAYPNLSNDSINGALAYAADVIANEMLIAAA